MSEQHSTSSAWPAPPNYYKRYTDDVLKQMEETNKSGIYPEVPVSLPPLPDFYLQSLEPPPQPSDAYNIFGQEWKVQDRLPTLEELGVKEILPSTDLDRVQELKKLNRGLIAQYLDLLDVLIKNPEEYGTRIENISMIFIKMHHILNEYRPHQARETLRLLMENQVERKRQQAAALRSKTQKVTEMLHTLGESITIPLIDDVIDDGYNSPLGVPQKGEDKYKQDVDMLEEEAAERGNVQDDLLISIVDEIV